MTSLEQSTATQQLSDLEAAILHTVVYADVFDFPVTPEEIWRWLPLPAIRAAVDGALAGPALSALFTRSGGYVMLQGREHVVPKREDRARSSRLLRREADRYGRWIARLPFVRMVAITGSLAVENAERDADIDYLVVTAPGRLWLTRAMTILVVHAAGLRRITLCPNYLLTEDVLELADHDAYTARELLQMVPLSGPETHARMLAANPWWHAHLPNATPRAAVGQAKGVRTRAAAERLLRARIFDRLEHWIMTRKRSQLMRNEGAEAVFDEQRCKGHFEGWRERTTRLTAERTALALEGLR